MRNVKSSLKFLRAPEEGTSEKDQVNKTRQVRNRPAVFRKKQCFEFEFGWTAIPTILISVPYKKAQN